MDVVLVNIETDLGPLLGIPIGLDKYNDDTHIIDRLTRVKKNEKKRVYKFLKITPYKIVWEDCEKALPEPREIILEQEEVKPAKITKHNPITTIEKPQNKHSFFDF